MEPSEMQTYTTDQLAQRYGRSPTAIKKQLSAYELLTGHRIRRGLNGAREVPPNVVALLDETAAIRDDYTDFRSALKQALETTSIPDVGEVIAGSDASTSGRTRSDLEPAIAALVNEILDCAVGSRERSIGQLDRQVVETAHRVELAQRQLATIAAQMIASAKLLDQTRQRSETMAKTLSQSAARIDQSERQLREAADRSSHFWLVIGVLAAAAIALYLVAASVIPVIAGWLGRR